MRTPTALYRALLAFAVTLIGLSSAWAIGGGGLAMGRAFSYAWNNPQQQPWDNPLQSPMYDAGAYASPDWSEYGRPQRNRTLDGPLSYSLQSSYAPSMNPMSIAPSGSSAVLAPMQLIPATGSVRKAVSLLAQEGRSDQPLTGAWLTSLAPDGPGAVRQPMMQGEADFRQGKYSDAVADFEAACQASSDSPESLLSLAQAYFALGAKSYGQSASYLAKAMKAFPDLPLVRVRPLDFFPSPEAYNQAFAALEAYTKANPRDGSALFLLAYLQWRAGLADAAFDTLDAATKAAPSAEIAGAIGLMNLGIGQTKQAVLAKAPPLSAPVDYSWAGVRLAVPEGFAGNPLTSLNRVIVGMVADKDENDVQLITLNAYPVLDTVTVGAFMDSVIESMRKAHFITDLTIDSELDVPFRGGKAMARMFSYAPAQGQGRISAAWFGFVREPKNKNDRPIAYLLGVAGSDKRADLHLATLAAMAKSIALIDPTGPGVPSLDHGSRIEDAKLQFSIVQPWGWAGKKTDRGYELGQMDFVRGSEFSPKAEVIVETVAGSRTPKSFGDDFIARQAKAGTVYQILSQGPAPLGGQEGYQYVLRQTSPGVTPVIATSQPAAAQNAQAADNILVGRLMSLPRPDGQKTLYVVVVQRRDQDPAEVQAVADRLAAGFTLLGQPGK